MLGSSDAAPRASTELLAKKPAGRGRAFLGRFVLAHFIAYPIAVVAAVGGTPLALWVRERAILDAKPTGARWTMVTEALAKYRVSATESAQVQIVLDFVILLSVATFTLVHLAALPWAIEAARKNARVGQGRTASFRLFVGITTATLIVVAVSGMVGWLWLLLQ
jgi:hypothetical protein